MTNGCKNSANPTLCRSFLKTSWQEMGPCLYNEGILRDMICHHFGDCQYNNHTWECTDIGHLMARVLNDSPFIVITAEAHLHSCFCQTDEACWVTVTDLLPSVLPALSTWVSGRTQWMCASGADTCSQCLDKTGRLLFGLLYLKLIQLSQEILFSN